MLKKEYLYGFNDVTIEPYYLTGIDSRSDIPDINNLLYTAPMDTVVGCKDSLESFYEAGVNTITVRGFWKKGIENFKHPYKVAVTLTEFQQFMNKEGEITNFLHLYKEKFGNYNILIDLANGHMQKLYDLSNAAKDKYGSSLDLMVGNIASPITYSMFSKIGVDSVRLSIGTGAACLTSAKTAIHYPAISLIDECKNVKDTLKYGTKIIMDGGIKDSSYIIKALAAGADGVMMGSMFNKCIESSGQKYTCYDNLKNTPLSREQSLKYYSYGTHDIRVDYRGMSTNAVQEKENGSHRNYEEGLSKLQKVEYTLNELLYELNYSIKSAFSYCDSYNNEEFYKNADLYLVTSKSHNIL